MKRKGYQKITVKVYLTEHKMRTEDEPFWNWNNPTISESRGSPLSVQSCSFQSFQQEPIRPRQEPMRGKARGKACQCLMGLLEI